jgi:hypothetical protein
MNSGRRLHTATLLRTGQVLVAGGIDGAGSSELYDPTTRTWTPTGELLNGRYWHTSTLLADGRVLVTGGVIESSAEIYDPANGGWTSAGSMNEGRYGHTATLLANGQVLVAGGPFQSSAELYDPNTGSWQMTGEMGIYHYLHSATRLRNGKVLVAGGDNWPNGGLRDAELYDPKPATWTTIRPMNIGRLLHTATLLDDGKVLVAAGLNSGVYGTPAAELYIPPPNKPPIALCHSVVREADDNCQTAVSASEVNNDSSDPDGDPLTMSLDPAGPFPLGTNSVTLLVNDDHGNTNTCVATIMIIDSQPPKVSCVLTQAVLWPPNHELANVGLSAEVSDNCGSGSISLTIGLFSNEDDVGPAGIAHFSPDAANIGVGTLRLRRECAANSGGRVYLIVITAKDASGNVGLDCCTVVVGPNRNEADLALLRDRSAAAKAYSLSHGGAPPVGYFVVGNGPTIGPKQ